MGAKDVQETRECSRVTSDNVVVLVTRHGQYANVVEVHIYSVWVIAYTLPFSKDFRKHTKTQSNTRIRWGRQWWQHL